MMLITGEISMGLYITINGYKWGDLALITGMYRAITFMCIQRSRYLPEFTLA